MSLHDLICIQHLAFSGRQGWLSVKAAGTPHVFNFRIYSQFWEAAQMEKHVRVETANPVVGQIPIRTQSKKKKKVSGVLTFVRSHFSPWYSWERVVKLTRTTCSINVYPTISMRVCPPAAGTWTAMKDVLAPHATLVQPPGVSVLTDPPTQSIGTFHPLNVNEHMQNRRASVQASTALCPRAP